MTIDSKQDEAPAAKVASDEETRARAESAQDHTPPVGEGKAVGEKPRKKKRGFFARFFDGFSGFYSS